MGLHFESCNPERFSNGLLHGVDPTDTEVQLCLAFFAATFGMLFHQAEAARRERSACQLAAH